MSLKKSKSKKEDLLATLRQSVAQRTQPAPEASIPPDTRTPPQHHQPEPAPASSAVPPSPAAPAKFKKQTYTSAVGGLYLREDDKRIIMERSTILYSKNIKPSNTLIVRAALRLLPRDHTFIEAVEQLIQEGKRRAND